LTERNWEYGKEFLMVFTDYKKAFDSAKRKELGKVQKNMNCSKPFEKSEK
jgi:hypothetical protein